MSKTTVDDDSQSEPDMLFSVFPVAPQVFYRTTLSFAIVNLKPLLPGHVLVCPRRVVPRLHDLRADEVSDLFITVQRLGKALEKIYKADALNIAIQDGVVAGQSVPHVHAHIIPRHKEDLPEDEIYRLLESDDADLNRLHLRKSKFPTPKPDAERPPRSDEEMATEARWLAGRIGELEKDIG